MQGGGNDSVWGGTGDDELDGGEGNDTVYFGDSVNDPVVAGVTASLMDGTATDGNGYTDTLVNFENISGTQFADQLSGDGGNNILTGNHGNDTLNGDAGDDQLFGGYGNDTIHGGGDNDRLFGGFGQDNLNGGIGNDTADYSDRAEGINADLTAGTVQNGNSSDDDTLASIENVTGTIRSDVLIGNSEANRLTGGGDGDTLSGMEGDDILQGGAGKRYPEWR